MKKKPENALVDEGVRRAQQQAERLLSHALFAINKEKIPVKRIAAHLMGGIHKSDLCAIIKEIGAIYPNLLK